MSRSRTSAREGLCCCEYENMRGEKSHVMAVLCDCEAVDSCCDFCLRCQPIPIDKWVVAIETVEDRCRLPFRGGALKLSLEACLPLCSLLLCLYAASSGPYCTLISITIFFLFILFFSRIFSYRGRSRLFVHTTHASVIVLFVVFITIVVGFRKILLWEILTLCTMLYVCGRCIRSTQRDPGYLKPENLKKHLPTHHSTIAASSLDEHNITWLDSRPIIEKKLQIQCHECQLSRPYRSSHCRRCSSCVLDRDHHCVWLDTCIGRHNHQSFVACLFVSLATLSYGLQLTWTTICTPEIYLDWFLLPADCRFVYNDFPSGMCVACCCYSIVLIIFLFLLLTHQCILISQNVTGQEFLKAKLTGKTKWFGFVATGNVNNKGFVRNWFEFVRHRRSRNIEPLYSV